MDSNFQYASTVRWHRATDLPLPPTGFADKFHPSDCDMAVRREMPARLAGREGSTIAGPNCL
jgi:hypothetical protein